MTLPVYPGPDLLPGMAYSSRWSPRFFNRSVETATGAQVSVAVAQHPLHDFELTYRFLRDGPDWEGALSGLEFRTMMGFFLQAGGVQGRFLYRNPDDFQVFQQRIGTGDGETRTFTLVRSFGANGYSASEPVGQVDSGWFNLYLDGSGSPVDPADYVLDTSDPCANTVTFDVAPEEGAAIAADMRYWYYCKLAEDQATFEKFMRQIWSIDRITLHSCRPGA